MPKLGLGLGAQNTNFELSYDPDARIYLAAVEAADGQGLESSVKNAINNFIVGCKADGIWNSIVTSCIMAGARTVAGAIVPLRGTAPTNNNFVAGDYSRTLGLLGDGTSKYLATGYNNNDTTNFPQNDTHISCYVSQSATNNNGIFIGTRLVALTSILQIRYSGDAANTIFQCRGSTAASRVLKALGFQCASRSLSTEFLSRCTHSGGISDATSLANSSAPTNNLIGVFAGFNVATPQTLGNPRMSFYSIGKSLTISLLDSRVTTLMNQISSALAITTSRAFNSIGGQVGSTNTGAIPASWLESESTVTSVIFANNNSVTSIGDYAFYQCTSLTSITIPNSVTSIGDYAFSNTSLASVTIPNSVTSIGTSAFAGCTSLTSITIPNSVTSIGDSAFSNTSLASVTIPNSVTSIGNYAFSGCSSLTTSTIGNSVTSIGNEAFSYCTSLTSVTFTPTSSVTTISSYAFSYCESLATITIPNSVTTIGIRAFQECINLATMNCYTTSSAFGTNGLEGVPEEQLTIHARTTDATWTDSGGEFDVSIAGGSLINVVKDLT